MISDMEVNGFDETKSKIPAISNKWIVNGAHRLASALANDVNVTCQPGIDVKDGQKLCDYNLFSKLGLDVNYMDRTAIEFAKLNPNSYMVCLFPAARGHVNDVIKILSDIGGIFYSKKVSLSNHGAFNLMRELYLDEPWAGTYPKFGGYNAKRKHCYPIDGNTYTFLVEFNTPHDAVKAKNMIRSIYNIGNHSVHINDTHEETIRISKLLFNENSIHHLNNMRIVNYINFDSLLREFRKTITANKQDVDNYCVTASSILSVYGLREGNDIDYLHIGPKLMSSNSLISSHNTYGVGRYTLPYDEIIHDANNHFYHRGIKFASLEIIKKMKLARNEPKDIKDIELINQLT